ncbi:MAG: lactate utilization protein [Christensenellaceae bacterium]|jgi:L-lactate utilization protein LutB|nr:lactate utilization protein [Christensenellaceae bacterium]
MQTPHSLYNQLLAQNLIANLAARNMEGFYCEGAEEARKKITELIPAGSSISCGGSATLHQIGLRAVLKNGDYRFLDPDDGKTGADKDAIAHEALGVDYYLMSSNAIAATGELVNADGYGNRVGALIFGPKKVIVIAGMNKVAPSLEDAIARVKTCAAPKTMLIFKRDYATLAQLQAAAELAQSQFVITHRAPIKGRITVLLIGEALGY